MAQNEDKMNVQVRIPVKLYEESLFFVKDRRMLNHYIEMGFEELVKRRQSAKGRALTRDEENVKRIVKEIIEEMRE